MQTIESRVGGAISVRVWREFGQLALEGLAIGVVFSLLLVAAVYMVARSSHGDEFAAAQSPPVELTRSVAT
jgi:predicted RND superfamily exporter protein